MHYDVVYDLRWFQATFSFCGPLMIPVVVPLVAAIVFLAVRRRRAAAVPATIATRVFVAFWFTAFIAVDILLIPRRMNEYLTHRRALAQHRYETVEGVVEHFAPSFGERKGEVESFDVAGHHYAYASPSLRAGFHQTLGNGGPIRSGVRVRIADVGGDIVRLEIAR